jgi:hypothetical protein
MQFKQFFEFDRKAAQGDRGGSDISEGIYYLYLIIGLQVVFVFSLLGIILFVGKLLSTPAWVFVFAMLLGVGGLVFVYRKARDQFRKFRENLQQVNLSNRNYEISFMGGVLTMRVEHNSRPLLEAPAPPAESSGNVLDVETVETPTPH